MAIYLGDKTLQSTNFNSSGETLNKFHLPDDTLLLNLNATNYNGGTWYDSAQGIPFPVVNTAPPKTSLSGIPCVDFNDSGYFESSAPNANKVDMRGAFTLILIYYHEGFAARRTIFEKAGTSYQSYQQELACTMEVVNTMTWYRGYPDYDSGNSKSYTTSAWNMIAINGNVSTTTGFYYNNGAWTAGYTNSQDGNILRSGAIRVGSGYSGTVQAGYLHACMVYGTDLSTDKINQVYNYYSNIFGLLGVTLYR
jgi:hypothetical protein